MPSLNALGFVFCEPYGAGFFEENEMRFWTMLCACAARVIGLEEIAGAAIIIR